MEYFKKGFGIKGELKSVLKILGFIFLTYFIIQGLFILIPVGILVYAGYRGVRFIQSKFNGLKKKETLKSKEFKEYKERNEYIYNPEVIDVEYEEVSK